MIMYDCKKTMAGNVTKVQFLIALTQSADKYIIAKSCPFQLICALVDVRLKTQM